MGKGEKERGASMTGRLLSVAAALLAMFAASAILLVVLTALTYYLELSERVVRIGILAIYVISGFVGGFLIGKIRKEKKFLWGFAVGVGYALILFAVSALLGNGAGEDAVGSLTVLAMSAAASTIGGMIS